jgi:hypothetical protein
MALWVSNADTDILVFSENTPQPPGRSLLLLANWAHDSPLSASGYDWSRIVAVEIDEPFNILTGDPCGSPNTASEFDYVDRLLAARAAELKSIAPLTRFWVNVTDREVGWMRADCALMNRAYMDVISLDRYYDFFDPDVRPYYDWLVAHPATPQQQLALIPGTFYRPGADDPGRQAAILQGYFDYANYMNQACNLPLGSRGVTGSYDGCRVWIVLGWLAASFNDGNTQYVGEQDPTSSAIAAAWRQELALPLRADIPHQPTMRQLQAIVPLLLDN